jgi:death-on-curing protein
LQSEPDWLDADLIIEFNKLAVAAKEPPEPHVLLKPDALESALANPINRWHYGERDAVVLAVVLLVSIGRNHPFFQGNKRCAFAAADYFLYLNGYELGLPDGVNLADLCTDVIIGNTAEQRLVETMWDYIKAD